MRAVLFPASGGQAVFDAGRILGFSLEQGSMDALMPGDIIGGTLTVRVYAPELSPRDWRGGALRLYAGGEAFGVYTIQSAEDTDIRGVYKLAAQDALSGRLEEAFGDPPEDPGSLAAYWAAWLGRAGVTSGSAVPEMEVESAPDWSDTSLRDAGSQIARAAGAYILPEYDGTVSLKPLNAPRVWEVSASECLSVKDGYRSFGPVGCLAMTDSDGETALSIGEGDAIVYEEDPLITDLAPAAANVLGAEYAKLEAEWAGRLGARPGDTLRLCGGKYTGRINRLTIAMDPEPRASAWCAVPEDSGGKALTRDGHVNASALVGRISGRMLEDGSVTLRKLDEALVTQPAVTALTEYLSALTDDQLKTDALAAAIRRAAQ